MHDDKCVINSSPATIGYKDLYDRVGNENQEIKKINETLRIEIEELKRAIINLALKLH